MTSKKNSSNINFLDEHISSLIFDNSDVAMRIISLDYSIIKANNAYAKICQSTPEKLTGNKCKDYLCTEKCDSDDCTIKQVITQKYFSNKRVKCNQNKEEIWYEINTSAIKDKKGNVVAVLESFKNINDTIKNELKIKRINQRLEQIIDCMSDWVWEVDEYGRYTFCSEQVYNFLGYTPEEIIGKTPFDLMPEAEAKKIGKIFQKLNKNKAPIKDLENWNLRKDNKLVCLLTNGTPMLDDNGNLIGYRGVDKDITEKKLKETKLKESEERLRILFENSSLGLFMASTKGQFHYANPSLLNILGYSKKDISSINYSEITVPDDFLKEKVLFKNLINKDTNSYITEKRLIHKNGDFKWVKINVSIAKSSGQSEYIIGVVENIHDIKLNIKELQKSKLLVNHLIEISPAAMRLVVEGKIIMSNKKYAELNNSSIKDVDGANCGDLLCSNSCGNGCGYEMLQNGADNLEGEIVRTDKNGKLIYLHFKVKSLFDENKNLTGMLQIFWDITDLKNTQKH